MGFYFLMASHSCIALGMIWNLHSGTANGTDTWGVAPGQLHNEIEGVCRSIYEVVQREALATRDKVKDAAEDVK